MSSAAAKRVRQQMMPWLITIVLLILWEVLTRASGISNVVLPPPSELPTSLASVNCCHIHREMACKPGVGPHIIPPLPINP